MLRTIALAAAFGALAISAQAATYEVQMLNRGADGMMVFEPAYIKVEPGDTVTFVPTDKSHNAETIPDMLPAGAEPFAGAINKEVSVTFTEEGIYGVKCKPHYAMGMVAVVQVGDVGDIEAAKAVKHPGQATKRMDAALAQVE
ncbi:pseudoazurin [Citreimonas salinaria]|uniref:Pseudoazurin n=1 Tax=Citreimonas salinaria TaxID=321339 RepID=A0A1H3P196_9RHOB|nr:pseudoazurin [Citreimonas salinaria]SDY94743.1 pseudoazurin [Citreimonas salinaria]